MPQAASRARKRLDPSEKGPTPSQLIFASGSWLSREAFQDLARSSTSRGAFFRLFMQTAVGLEEHVLGYFISFRERSRPIRLRCSIIGYRHTRSGTWPSSRSAKTSAGSRKCCARYR